MDSSEAFYLVTVKESDAGCVGTERSGICCRLIAEVCRCKAGDLSELLKLSKADSSVTQRSANGAQARLDICLHLGA